METLTRETDEMGMRDIGIQLESTGSHLDETKRRLLRIPLPYVG